MSEALGTNAWHGEPLLKETVVAEALAHEAADRVLQASIMLAVNAGENEYWSLCKDGVWRGCSIGCIGHTDEHRVIADMFGFPVDLIYEQEAAFEDSSLEYSRTWTSRWLQSIPVGADLSGIYMCLRGFRHLDTEALGDKMISLVSALAPSPHTPADQPHARKYADIAVLAKAKG